MSRHDDMPDDAFSGVLPAAAQPSSKAQIKRYRRIIQESTALLAAGGVDALQMKDVASRSDVALSTLYRYFPSKQWLILAAAIHGRRTRMTESTGSGAVRGRPSDRAASFLLAHLRYELSRPLFTAAVRQASYSPEFEIRALVDQLQTLFLKNLVQDAGPFSSSQLRLADMLIRISDLAAAQWSAGLLTAREARFDIIVACKLLDLAPDEIEAASDSSLEDPTVVV